MLVSIRICLHVVRSCFMTFYLFLWHLVRQVAVLGLFLSVLFSLYLVPLGMYSPCIKEAGTLGPAPTLIGHRGAPMVRLN